MRVAQIAPLYEAVPPRGYGGTERVVHWLTEELVARGVEVTLFASNDSSTAGQLVPCCERALRPAGRLREGPAWQILMIEQVLKRENEFDVIHSHVDYLPFPHFRRLKLPAVTTMHGRLDLPELVAVFNEFREQPVVSISLAQRTPLLMANWVGNVYHGLPANQYSFIEEPEDYLVFVGRICPEKRVDRAIEIAGRTGLNLKVAAKVDPVDRGYFERSIEHLLKSPWVEYVGEVGEVDKAELIGKARALLFPIDWPEPFGLVMIEAMACGTPVIAFSHGSVPEIIDHGQNGFVCANIDEAVAAVCRLTEIPRQECRRKFEERFTAERMARDYLRVYERVAAERARRKLVWLATRGAS